MWCPYACCQPHWHPRSKCRPTYGYLLQRRDTLSSHGRAWDEKFMRLIEEAKGKKSITDFQVVRFRIKPFMHHSLRLLSNLRGGICMIQHKRAQTPTIHSLHVKACSECRGVRKTVQA